MAVVVERKRGRREKKVEEMEHDKQNHHSR
jgi:hypothetical protein